MLISFSIVLTFNRISILILIDICDLDSGSVGKVTFPNPNDLTKMVVNVTPDSGFWSGATYEFTIDVPALYPHEPPKVCEFVNL